MGDSSQRIKSLAVATTMLTVNFWAWSLLSPLASRYATELSLAPVTISVILAMPVVIGSLGRIPIGILTDHFGGRRSMPILTLASIVPIVALYRISSFEGLMAVGVLLGLAGTTFAAGAAYVTRWFTERRGLALGIYAMGNAGTAISGLLTPSLAEWLGRETVFGILIFLLIGVAAMCWLLGANPPGWRPPLTSSWQQLKMVAANAIVWDLAVMYAITFGAFVAFALYLPVMLEVAYELPPPDASARAAGFVILATLARPVGGWLSDTYGGGSVIKAVLATIILLAGLSAFQSDLTMVTTAVFLGLAVVLGAGSGAVMALLSHRVPAEMVGGAIGVVGAVGGLGGFLPPMVLGSSLQLTGSYAVALLLLAAAAAIALVYFWLRFRSA